MGCSLHTSTSTVPIVVRAAGEDETGIDLVLAVPAVTRALNTGSIGVALDAMAGALERPFSAGRYPITNVQRDTLATEVADLCLTYDIPVSRWSVMSHAEVQPTLGIWQRAKWDITWLPDMVAPGDPVAVGERLREMIRARLPVPAAA